MAAIESSVVTLSPEELERYARHIVMAEIGGSGQQKLKQAKVLVVGAGGLGSPVIQYLAAAGVGTIGIVDDDVVARSNLQRQVIHDSDRIDDAKTSSAADAVARINPNTQVVEHTMRLDESNANTLVANYDLVADGSDNFTTRYLVADTCQALAKPLVTAAVGRFDGSLTTLKPYSKDLNGTQNPSYRDLFPQPPKDGVVPTCAEEGVLGVLTGVMGSLQALEILKEITGVGDTLVGRLLLLDAKSMRFETIRYTSSTNTK